MTKSGKTVWMRALSAVAAALSGCVTASDGVEHYQLSTDLADMRNVNVEAVKGVVTLAETGERFFFEDFTDPSHWEMPKIYHDYIRVTVGADQPNGGKCLEAVGLRTNSLDTAWCVHSKTFPLPDSAPQFVFRAEVSSTEEHLKLDCRQGWSSAVAWFDAAGRQIDLTPLSYSMPGGGGFSVQRSFGNIPKGAKSFKVSLGFDSPNLFGGDTVRFRNLELGFVRDRKRYEHRGAVVSYPRAAGPVSWEADVPAGTAVRLQYASAETAEGLRRPRFRGPDGTAKTFFDRPFAPTGRFIRYRVVLESDGRATPVLRGVTVGDKVDRLFLGRPDRLAPYARIVNATAPIPVGTKFRPEIKVTDDNLVDWPSVKIAIDGEEATAQFARAGDILRYTGPDRDWTPGLHHVVVDVRDWSGNAHKAQKRFYIGTEPATTPRATLRDDGVLLVGGKPTFPIGMYGLKKCAANGGDLDRALKDLKAAGFNAVQTYQARERAELLKAAADNGMYMFTKPRMPDDWLFADSREQPAIIAWYLGDDTSEHCTPMELKDRMDAMKAADGTRLTCQADGNGAGPKASGFYDYAPATDVFLMEIYPIRGNDADRHAAALVAKNTKRAKSDAAAHGWRNSLWPILQYFQGWTNWKRYPTPEELMSTTFAALAQDVQGITWYTYEGGPSKSNPRVFNCGCVSTPERWAVMSAVSKRVAELAPVFLERTPADQPKLTVVSGPEKDYYGNDSIQVLLKRHGGATYLISVNTAAEPVTAKLTFAAGAAKGEVLWENRTVELSGGALTDTFAPNGVHVYRFR